MKKSLALGVALFTAGSAQAQVTITPLIEEGDMLAPLGLVTRIDNVDVNNSGDWMVELDTDNADTSADNGVVFNGTLIHMERSSMGIPAPQNSVWQYDGTIDSMDINDNGDRLVLMRVEDIAAPSSATDGELLIWTSGSTGISYVLLESRVTPNTADPDQTMSPVWDRIDEVWQNNNNQIVVGGNSSNYPSNQDMLVILEHDGAGTITSQTLFGLWGVNHATAFPPSNGVHNTPVQGFQFTKNRLAINDLGQKMFFIDDDHTVAGGNTTNDAHIYIDTFEIMAEDDISPDPAEPWGSMTTHEVDINNNGDWLMLASDDAFDYYLIQGDPMGNFVVLQQEGGEPPHLPGSGFAFTGTFSNAPIGFTDAGDYFWWGDWDDPDTTIDTGLFKNETIIVQEGITMIGTEIIDTIPTSTDERAFSDSGRYVIAVLEKVGSIEGAYLIDTASLSYESYCFGDGGTSVGCTDCPCGNNAPGGSGGGCLNSAGTSAMLVPSGVPAVGADTLRFEVSGATPSTFGILQSADNRLPQMGPCAVGSGILSPVLDGLRCVGGNALRHGTRAIDANGDIGQTGNAWGPPSGPPGGLIAFNGFVTGQTRNFQCFYREDVLQSCQTGQNTTNAVSVTFQ